MFSKLNFVGVSNNVEFDAEFKSVAKVINSLTKINS
jgi:hypothetical protein